MTTSDHDTDQDLAAVGDEPLQSATLVSPAQTTSDLVYEATAGVAAFGEPVDMARRTFLTISEAAQRSGVNRMKLRRMVEAGAFPNAKRSAATKVPTWVIPVSDLLAAGLTPSREPAPSDQATDQAQDQGGGGVERAQTRPDQAVTRSDQDLVALRLAFEVTKAKLEGAERVIAAQEKLIAVLEAGQTAPKASPQALPAVSQVGPVVDVPDILPSRPWWRRILEAPGPLPLPPRASAPDAARRAAPTGPRGVSGLRMAATQKRWSRSRPL